MKNSVFLLAVALCLPLSALELSPPFLVVRGDDDHPVENRAAAVLAEWLGQMLGKPPTIITESRWEQDGGDQSGPALLVGRTRYLQRHGIDLSQASAEEWVVRATPDGKVALSGGRPRGTLYAVYEFLESLGCRWFCPGGKHVPRVSSLVLPEHLLLRGQPVFNRREWWTAFSGNDYKAMRSWNRCTSSAELDADAAGLYNSRQDGNCNTFFEYGQSLPKGHPEYFSLVKGERLQPLGHHGPGQLCMWHPDVRAGVKKELARRRQADLDKCAEKGWTPITHYLISINDCRAPCECEGCTALVKKYGTYAGAQLDFINDIARDFPDLTIITRAYQHVEDAPTPGTIVAEKNVMLSMAYIGLEFRHRHDTMRPLSHPANQETWNKMAAWREIVSAFDVWDYRRIFNLQYPAAYTNIPVIRADLPFLADFGVRRYFAEPEYDGCLPCMAFHDLGIYLLMRLCVNPHADAAAVIADFMEKYYGAAGPFLNQYLNLLIERQTASEQSFTALPVLSWDFLDADFFRAAAALLAEAEKAVTDDPERHDRVMIEYIPFACSLLEKWPLLQPPGQAPLPFDREYLHKKLLAGYEVAAVKYPAGQAARDNQAFRLRLLCGKLPLPPGFPPDSLQIPAAALKNRYRRPDEEAAFGYAIVVNSRECAPNRPGVKTDFHARPAAMGIQNRTVGQSLAAKTLETVPADEKYHWRYVGRVQARGNVVGWTHWTWYNTFAIGCLNPDTTYDAYYSIKLEGPSYVEGSARGDAFAFDRAVFVPVHGDGKPLELK